MTQVLKPAGAQAVRRALGRLLGLAGIGAWIGISPSQAQVSIEYVNSQFGQWGAGITAHPNVPTLEAAESLILSDLRNVEPLSAALGGRPWTRFYTFEGI